jgi:sodium transport system ATP-binding protein
MLEVKSLGKTFATQRDKRQKNGSGADPREEGNLFHALRKVEFVLPRGAILGLLGANGAGKTTLMRLLATSLKPTSGAVNLLGFDLVRDADEIRRRVGFLSGSTGLYNHLNATELLTFYGRLYGLGEEQLLARIKTLFEELEIREYAHRRIENLSAGMKQRVSIARSLVHSPEFIIFDEPTTGLDVPSAQVILSHMEKYRASGRSIIFSTHHMHEVERLCDQVVLIHQGLTCFNGTVEEMKGSARCSRLDEAYLVLTGEDSSRRMRQPELREITMNRTGSAP